MGLVIRQGNVTDFSDTPCLFGFYGISTSVGYLMSNQFLYK